MRVYSFGNRFGRSYVSLLVVLVLGFIPLGCGGGDAPPTDEAAAPAAAVEPLGTAAVTGSVRFTGTPPELPVLGLDRECTELHDEPVHSQHVVVNDNGTLRYVFVYVKEGLGEGPFPQETEPVVLDQEGCMYEPHVFGVQTGQTIQILNSDPLLHNIHAMPEENRPFNFGMPTQNSSREESFRVPEVMVPIKCDVHGWMLAYAGVLEHPYFSTTGEDGSFRIEGLPAGTYTLEAWHEEYGTATQDVTVEDGGTATVDFTFGDAAAV